MPLLIRRISSTGAWVGAVGGGGVIAAESSGVLVSVLLVPRLFVPPVLATRDTVRGLPVMLMPLPAMSSELKVSGAVSTLLPSTSTLSVARLPPVSDSVV